MNDCADCIECECETDVSALLARSLGEVESLDVVVLVTTPIGYQIKCEEYFPLCPVGISDFLLPTSLIILPMNDFNVILGSYHAVMECLNKTTSLKVVEDSVEFLGKRKSVITMRISVLEVEQLLKVGCGLFGLHFGREVSEEDC